MNKKHYQRLVEGTKLSFLAILCVSVAFWLGIRSAQSFICLPIAISPTYNDAIN